MNRPRLAARSIGPSESCSNHCAVMRSVAPEQPRHTIFLLSPANLAGERAGVVCNPAARFPLARELQSSGGAALGELFSFVSGLYFRGKATYAAAFGRPPPGLAGGLVISPGEGLRFLDEPVTLDRVRAWARSRFDEHNPRFTEPLERHAAALSRAHRATTRFVLLGSVASDKYVEPLVRVFGERLLFSIGLRRAWRHEPGRAPAQRGSGAPRAFVRIGRGGDAPRPAGGAPLSAKGVKMVEVVVLVGLPGAGKTTFFRQRFAATHAHVSGDNFQSHARPARRQAQLIAEALSAGRSLVVDNTNPTVDERAAIITEARRQGARAVAYFFDCTSKECLARNETREGRARIPRVGIFAAAKRLTPPSREEGFDEVFAVHALPEQRFEVCGGEPRPVP